jgi:5-methylthioadenosine/S-adenosylhomocysteine deaminase
MITVDHIIHAGWIVTCEEKNRVLKDHALIMHQSLIKDIIPSAKVSDLYKSESTQNYSSHAIIPGLINSHTHLGMTYLRGVADDLALMDWLNNYIWPAEKKWAGHDFVRDGTEFAIAELIRSGTTCFNEMYFFMHDTAKAAEKAGIRAKIGAHVITFPTNWAKDLDDELVKAEEFIKAYKDHSLIGPTMAAHAIYTVPEAPLLRVKEMADRYNLKINIHVHETAHEVQQSLADTHFTPVQRLNKIGFMTPQVIAIHMTQVSDIDLEIMAKGKPNIVHCPMSNMKLASGICPVEKLQSVGLNVALGTDSSASNNDLNMINEMRTASLLAKLSGLNPESLSAENVLKMATINGAKALGIDHITGSLEIGKSADFAAIDLNFIETQPLYHPISQIVYAASRQQVDHVWVAGKQLLKNRKLLTLDEELLLSKAKAWGEKIKNT